MPQVRYFRRKRLPHTKSWMKVCGHCGGGNEWARGHCQSCSRPLVARPKKRRQRDLDERLTREGELLDEWLSKMVLAVTKVRYYRTRVKTLERQRGREVSTPRGTRGIRVRD